MSPGSLQVRICRDQFQNLLFHLCFYQNSDFIFSKVQTGKSHILLIYCYLFLHFKHWCICAYVRACREQWVAFCSWYSLTTSNPGAIFITFQAHVDVYLLSVFELCNEQTCFSWGWGAHLFFRSRHSGGRGEMALQLKTMAVLQRTHVGIPVPHRIVPWLWYPLLAYRALALLMVPR